jgi:hypothetical protein
LTESHLIGVSSSPQNKSHARHFPKGRTRVDAFIVAL